MSQLATPSQGHPVHRRERLLRPWQLLLVALTALVALLLLGSSAAPVAGYLARPDSWTLQYLRLMVAVRPQDLALRLQLVDVLLLAGQLAEADQILSLLGPVPKDLQARLLSLRLRLHVAQFTQQADPSKRPLPLQAHIAQGIEALLREPLSVAELAGLAGSSLTIGRPDLAGRIYLRLVEIDAVGRSKWLLLAAQQQHASGHAETAGLLYDRLSTAESDLATARRYALLALTALISADRGQKALELVGLYLTRFPSDREILEVAAKLALANQKPTLAAHYYEQIAAAAPDAETQRRFGRLALLALVAGNQVDAALRLAEQLLGKFPTDTELLEIATKLAQGNQQPRLAQTWGRVLLAQDPQNSARISRQLTIEISAGDLNAALLLARRLVRRHPHSAKERAQLAQIAEWSGQPQLALQHWVELALQTGARRYLDRALKMAPQLYELEQLARLLAFMARRGRLSNAELLSLVETFEGIGEPEQLVAILKDYLRRYPDHQQAWQALAEVHERRGDLVAALQTFQRVSRDGGSNLAEITHRASLLWELQRPSEAYVLLRDVLDHSGVADRQQLLTSAALGSLGESSKPSAEDSTRATYLQTLAHLFWLHEPRPETLEDYRQLWRQGALTIQSAGRFMYLTQTQGLHSEAIAIGELAFSRFKDPEFLISAMELAYEHERWPDLDRLVRLSREHIELFATRRNYFLVLADYYLHQRNYEGAQAAYLKLLALDPSSAMARTALLWLHIDHGSDLPHGQGKRSRSMLARLLSKWHNAAKSEPAMWLPVATGYAMLGRSQQAVSFYQREWTARPTDHLWLLGAVTALDAVSRSSDARRLRRSTLEQLRPEALRAAHAATSPAEREVLKAYVELVRDLYGPGKGSRWLVEVLRRDLDPSVRTGLLAVWRSTGEQSVSSEWVADTSSISRQNPWGRFTKAAKPSQDGHQVSLIDAGALPDETTEPAPAPLQVLAQDSGADERGGAGRSLIVRAESAVQTINDLLLASGTLSVLLVRGAWALGAQLGIQEIFFGGASEPGTATTAFALEGQAMWRHRLGRLDVGIGANLRGDASLLTGYISESFTPLRGSTLQLGVYFNELVSDTRWLRIYGTRHRATIGLNTHFLTDGIINLQSSFFHYHTRLQEPLSAGANVDLDIGYRLRRLRPLWTLRATASYTRNFLLTDQLPQFGSASSDAQPLVDLLPLEFAAIGIGSRVEHRFPGTSSITPGRFRYMADAWLGWIWPLNIPAFEMNAGITLALPRKHEISLTGFVANNRWLGPGVINAGLGLRYLFR